jgi:hypothetical protein
VAAFDPNQTLAWAKDRNVSNPYAWLMSTTRMMLLELAKDLEDEADKIEAEGRAG